MNIEIAPKETEIVETWENAQMYCLFLNVDGKTGWRLPTLEELNEIYESKNDFVSATYWSSTKIGSNHWSLNMSSGNRFSNYSKDFIDYVRAVRDIK